MLLVLGAHRSYTILSRHIHIGFIQDYLNKLSEVGQGGSQFNCVWID